MDILPDKVVFYIEGKKVVVTTLRLTAKFLGEFDGGEEIQKFKVIGALLF